MNSPIRWFGGKGSLSEELIKSFPPASKYTTYVEPFSGGASLLFALPPAPVEVYNDKDKLLVNFFKVLRDDGQKFIEKAQLVPYSRMEYYEAKKLLKLPKHTVIEFPIETALQFFIIARQCVSGDIFAGWSHGKKTSPIPNWLSAVERLSEIVLRLKGVQIENLDALACIKKYDSTTTLFYVDPPYVHEERSSTRYRYDYKWFQHDELLKVLKKVQGMVILSGYHGSRYDDAIDAFGDWGYRDIDVVCQAAASAKGEGSLKESQKRTEVIWWNNAVTQAVKQLKLF